MDDRRPGEDRSDEDAPATATEDDDRSGSMDENTRSTRDRGQDEPLADADDASSGGGDPAGRSADPPPGGSRRSEEIDRIPIDPSLDIDIPEPPPGATGRSRALIGAAVGGEPTDRDHADGSSDSALRDAMDRRRDAGSESSGPPGDPSRGWSTGAVDPDPAVVRRWAGVLGGLGLASFLTAAIVQWDGGSGERSIAGETVTVPHEAALAAAILGVVFLAIGLVGIRTRPAVFGILHAAWVEHRSYTYVSFGLFAAGTLVGAILAVAGYDILAIIESVLGEHPFEGIEPDDLTAEFYIRNNTIPFVMAIVGAITLGILTVYLLVLNGLVVGNVVLIAGAVLGADYVVIGLAPHGVFELTAIFIAAGVGFRLLHRFISRVRGTRSNIVSKPYLVQTLALVVFAWLLLALAAVVEAHVTEVFLEGLFADRGEDVELTVD